MRFMARLFEGEKGFSLTEILVAGLILVWGLIPVVGMFDQSFKGFRNARQLQQSINCARAAMEQIKGMPFYVPHDERNLNLNLDIDDRFWGNRNPVYANPSKEIPGGQIVPDWDHQNLPKVTFYEYGQFRGYENFKVQVQLSYFIEIKSADGKASVLRPVQSMKTTWGPKTVGNDRPTDDQNRALSLLLVRVVVSARGAGGEDVEMHSLESMVTSNDALYNLGISAIEVLGPDSIKDPEGKLNAAAHWSSPDVDVQVRIRGWGFKATGATGDLVQAWLVRDQMIDTPINLTYRSESELRGTVRLYSGHNESSNVNPWTPRAAIGYWTVKVRQEGLFSAYLYNGFIVQYPQPIISDFWNVSDNKKEGLNSWSSVQIKIKGGPFCFPVEYPAVRMIRFDENGAAVDQLDGTVEQVTAPSNSKGYALSPNCEITALFDLTKASPGEYVLQVVNTREPTIIGHVASPYSQAKYLIREVAPEVDDVFVNATGSRKAYSNAGNPWELAVVGRYFSVPLEVYLCSSVTNGQPSGNFVKGVVKSVSGGSAIVADFNLSTLPDGNYKAYVRNLSNGAAGWTTGNPLTVVRFSATLTGLQPESGYNFFENYYDIRCRLTGSGLNDVYRLELTDGTSAGTYDITGDILSRSDTEIRLNLNLIGCDSARSWRIRAVFAPNVSLERNFTVTVGPAVLHARFTPNSVIIHRYYWAIFWNYINPPSSETSTTTAAAIRSGWSGIIYVIRGARFEVAGMGFDSGGTNVIRAFKGNSYESAPSDQRWETNNTTVVIDRAAKLVKLVSNATWTMPNTTWSNGSISVRNGSMSSFNVYTDRWRLVDP